MTAEVKLEKIYLQEKFVLYSKLRKIFWLFDKIASSKGQWSRLNVGLLCIVIVCGKDKDTKK